MTPALLVLAAGMGSRYGGLKQLDPMGPHGETVMDYAIFDALRAGFGRVIFVIRPDRELVTPANVRVVDRADHGELFREASLVIGHGGHSTTFRALAHGVPVLLLPMHPLLDQPMIGKAVQRAGAGRMLPRTARPDRIGAAVAAVLADRAMQEAARSLGERLRATDAAGAGADAVERLIGERTPTTA